MTLTLPNVHVALIAKHDRNNPANMARPNVDDFAAVIHLVADFYECPGDQVRGWMAAQRVLHLQDEPAIVAVPDNGDVPAVPARASHMRWYTNALETGAISLPRFCPYNILWRLADVHRPSMLNSYLGPEVVALEPLTYEELQLLGALVTAKFSVGLSTSLL